MTTFKLHRPCPSPSPINHAASLFSPISLPVRLLLTCLVVIALTLLPSGCTQGGSATTGGVTAGPSPITRTPAGIPLVRVRLLQDQSSVRISASSNPGFKIAPAGAKNIPESTLAMAGKAISITHSPSGWVLGGSQVARGELHLLPRPEGSLSVNGKVYRGNFRLVPTSGGKFDVVNDVEIDAYLKSVVSKELLKDWHPEAFKAQAIIARTYALYEIATSGGGRHWDVYDDERSQVYGGLSAESSLSVQGVETTRGIVLAYGNPGVERIFKTYFSACCGGIGQSASDAFNDPLYPPLTEKNVGTLCGDSPRYQWGPVTLTKAEATRRIKLWGAARSRSEANLVSVSRIQPSHQNRFGRPVRFLLTDSKGTQYSLMSEELRTALNTASPGRTAWSGFILIRDNGNSFTFSGRGSGHGVGMCQYCCQAMALQGRRHEDIVRFSYPGSVLIRAY